MSVGLDRCVCVCLCDYGYGFAMKKGDIAEIKHVFIRMYNHRRRQRIVCFHARQTTARA